MSKYRKKPVVIDAWLVPPDDEQTREIPAWVMDAVLAGKLKARPDGTRHVLTLEDGKNGEAEHVADVGDYIIRGVKGELYPCKPDIFALTYETVDETVDLLAAEVNDLVQACHSASVEAGWWTHKASGLDLKATVRGEYQGPTYALLAGALVSQKLVLIHSEISEAMEGHRKGLPDDKLPHRTMLEVELADAVIRIADLAGALGLDLGAAIVEKMAFNAVRPDHKPEARAAAGGKAY